MTISSQTRKAGPFVGAGSTGPYSFSFKVFTASDLLVVKVNTTTSLETKLNLTTDYTVSLNANQNTNPGGSITLVSALAVGYNMVISSQVAYTQETDLTNQGGFYPEVITDALDKLTIETQQLKEAVDRSAKLPITSAADANQLTDAIISVSQNSTNINAVSANIGDINTVAGISTDVSTVADNVTDVSSFAGIYYGPSATDPLTRKNGSALQTGDLYFNTVSSKMRIYFAGWVDVGVATPVTITIDKFNGTGSQTAFTLSTTPGFANAVSVEVSGVGQRSGIDFSVSGTTLTFTSAPPSGTNNIYVTTISSYAGGVPNDKSVTSAKLATTIDLGAL